MEPTNVFEDAVLSGRTNMIGQQGATPLEGGLPLHYKGWIVGASGPSHPIAPDAAPARAPTV